MSDDATRSHADNGYDGPQPDDDFGEGIEATVSELVSGAPATPDRAAMIKQVASVIADRIIDWADEGDAASRYPIPPWTVYEEIARTILELPRV